MINIIAKESKSQICFDIPVIMENHTAEAILASAVNKFCKSKYGRSAYCAVNLCTRHVFISEDLASKGVQFNVNIDRGHVEITEHTWDVTF